MVHSPESRGLISGMISREKKKHGSKGSGEQGLVVMRFTQIQLVGISPFLPWNMVMKSGKNQKIWVNSGDSLYLDWGISELKGKHVTLSGTGGYSTRKKMAKIKTKGNTECVVR